MIDRRAIFCRHCKQTIAQHVQCPNCQEPRVPDDLEFCWKCGLKMRTDERIECPRCFSWRGYEDEFPCRVCGFDPKEPITEAAGAVPGVEGPMGAQPAASGMPEGSGGMPLPAAVAPEPAPAPAQVQCPTCYSMVEAGPRCSVCSGLLEAS
jgi:hypothetical protein